MGDAGISEQAFELGLAQGHDVAQEQGEQGHHHQHRLDRTREFHSCDQAVEGGEGGRLHHRAHIGGHQGGRAFIDVRTPEVEGHGCHFEGQSCDGEEQAKEVQHVGRPARRGCRSLNRGQVQGCSGAIEQCDAHEEEARGEGSLQEVFEGRLTAPEAVPLATREDVQGDAQDLDPQEQYQQIGITDQQYRTDQ